MLVILTSGSVLAASKYGFDVSADFGEDGKIKAYNLTILEYKFNEQKKNYESVGTIVEFDDFSNFDEFEIEYKNMK